MLWYNESSLTILFLKYSCEIIWTLCFLLDMLFWKLELYHSIIFTFIYQGLFFFSMVFYCFSFFCLNRGKLWRGYSFFRNCFWTKVSFKMRKDFQEHLLRTHGQNQRRVGSRVGSGDGCDGRGGNGRRKMEMTVLEQQ